jgi:hypothetical protein
VNLGRTYRKKQAPSISLLQQQIADPVFNIRGHAPEDGLRERRENEVINTYSPVAVIFIHAVKGLSKAKEEVWRESLAFTPRELGRIEAGLRPYLVVGYTLREPPPGTMAASKESKKQQPVGIARPDSVIAWAERNVAYVVSEILEAPKVGCLALGAVETQPQSLYAVPNWTRCRLLPLGISRRLVHQSLRSQLEPAGHQSNRPSGLWWPASKREAKTVRACPRRHAIRRRAAAVLGQRVFDAHPVIQKKTRTSGSLPSYKMFSPKSTTTPGTDSRRRTGLPDCLSRERKNSVPKWPATSSTRCRSNDPRRRTSPLTELFASSRA